MDAGKILAVIIAVMLGLLFVAYLIPVGLDAMADADQTKWGDAEKSMWDLIPLFAVIVLIIVFAAVAIAQLRRSE